MAVVYTRNRISHGSEMLMGAVAWAAYGIDFLINIILDWIGVGEILSPIFMLLVGGMFVFWFATKGVNVFKPRILREIAFKVILSFIPIVNIFAFSKTKNGLIEPSIRAAVRRVIEITREEDDQYNQEQAAKTTSSNSTA